MKFQDYAMILIEIFFFSCGGTATQQKLNKLATQFYPFEFPFIN